MKYSHNILLTCVLVFGASSVAHGMAPARTNQYGDQVLQREQNSCTTRYKFAVVTAVVAAGAYHCDHPIVAAVATAASVGTELYSCMKRCQNPQDTFEDHM